MSYSIIQDFDDGSFIKVSKNDPNEYVVNIVDIEQVPHPIWMTESEIVQLKTNIETLLRYRVRNESNFKKF